MYQTFLRDSSFFALLLRFDQDLAEQARQAGCRCRPIQIPLPIEVLPKAVGIAPRLRELMAEYAATGLPPAYLPTEQEDL